MPESTPTDAARSLVADLTDRLVYLLGTYPHLVEPTLDLPLLRRARSHGWLPHAPAAVTTFAKLLGRAATLALLRHD